MASSAEVYSFHPDIVGPLLTSSKNMLVALLIAMLLNVARDFELLESQNIRLKDTESYI